MHTPARRVTRRTAGLAAGAVERPARRVTGLAIVAIVIAATFVPWTASIGVSARAADVTKRTWKLAPGVKLTRLRYPNVPNEVRILTVFPQRGPRFDGVTAGPDFPMYKLTSGMAASNGAIAGVNGDFATKIGSPVHITMVDGELWNSGSSGGTGFAVTHDGTNAYIGIPRLRLEARVTGEKAQILAEWNVGKPSNFSIHAYTRRGGTGIRPPGDASPSSADPIYCAVRLGVRSSYDWTKGRKLITRTYEVLHKDCARTKMNLGDEPGNVVLASKSRDGNKSNWLQGLRVGSRLRLAYGFAGWPGVTDVVGGTPMLVRDGKNVAPKYTSGADNLLWYNPRTSVGINRGCVDVDNGTACKIWVVTVDGRQSPNWSKGMQLPRLAEEFQRLGAKYAMNMDGGASTTMWIKRKRDAYCLSTPGVGGCLVNRPSASFGERVTINGLSLLPQPDPDTPTPLR